ncbi:MAG: hypothetical protein AAF310_01120 [Myxococcota bacterium]
MISPHDCVPCCYHPSTAVVVDSSRSNMQQLRSLLPQFNRFYRFYINSIQALEFLDSRQHPLTLEPYWQQQPHNPNCFRSGIFEQAVRSLLQRAFDPQRHQQITTVIANQPLFHLTGAQLCKRIRLPHVQTLLIGHDTMLQEAIDLINHQTINAFVRNSELNRQLATTATQLQQYFFQSFSAPLYDLLFFFEPNHPLFDKAVAEALQQTVKQVDAAEFYLCGPRGDFILITAKGDFTGFVVRSETQITDLLNSQEAKRASTRVIESLKQGTHILCLPPKGHGGPIPVAQWQKHLYEAKTLKGKQMYRYAAVPNWVALNNSFTPLAYCPKPDLPFPVDADKSTLDF